MNFGYCNECGKYNFLGGEDKCKACLDSDSLGKCECCVNILKCERCGDQLLKDCEHNKPKTEKLCVKTGEVVSKCDCSGYEIPVSYSSILEDVKDIEDNMG